MKEIINLKEKIKPQLYVNLLTTVKDNKVYVVKYEEVLDNKGNSTGDKEAIYTEIPSGKYLMSTKMDGVRAIITDHSIESRSKMTFPNDNLTKEFKHLKEYCKEHNVILDGEFYSHKVGFSDIITICMTKGSKVEIPESLTFHCFDCIPINDLEMPFNQRIKLIPTNIPKLEIVEQIEILIPQDANILSKKFREMLDLQFEGLIIRGSTSKYKFGRTTPNCGTGYKFKEYNTYDAKILGVIQATVVKDGVETTTNQLGRSVTSKKKDDRESVEMASAFLCEFKGKQFKVSLGLTNEFATKIWQEKDKYIGQYCEFKAMETTKDLPRSPGFLRMRWKNEFE